MSNPAMTFVPTETGEAFPRIVNDGVVCSIVQRSLPLNDGLYDDDVIADHRARQRLAGNVGAPALDAVAGTQHDQITVGGNDGDDIVADAGARREAGAKPGAP